MDPWEKLNQKLLQCRECPRLVDWREAVSRQKRRAFVNEIYWGKPVPGFGDPQAKVLVVGLAPGAHGSNRTGRMFTGDASGNFLYPALYRAGFANQPVSNSSQDGLKLNDLYITAVCRCVPPENKPTPLEIKTCGVYLRKELDLLGHLQGVIALGAIAYQVMAQIFTERGWLERVKPFSHLVVNNCGGHPWLMASYHPSRQNTQTGRLTEAMFDQVWKTARGYLRRV